ncbi:MAG: RND family transporter [Methanothrix sp.]|nr:RND family transporter [Methanothrix sp.]
MNSMKRFGKWITENPIIIIIIAILLTIFSIQYAQQIEAQGMATESFVSQDSSLYQLYDHLYKENFGTDQLVVLIEGDDVAKVEVLKAALRFSDHMKMTNGPRVAAVQSVADGVADAEYQTSGIRLIPPQEKIDRILESADPAQMKAIMPDRRHTMIVVGVPAYLKEGQRNEILAEMESAVKFAEFPAGYGLTITGDPAFQAAVVDMMNNSNGSILALAGLLMVGALLLVFRHVRWPLLPIPVVFLGIIWTFGAMGFLQIPMTMVSFAAFPVLIGIGIDYAIQFHNRIDEELVKGKLPVEAAINTVNHVAIPVIVALTVTEAGFVALLSSTVPMIKDFGKLCIIGLVMCYLSALFVGVTVLLISERKSPRKMRDKSQSGDTSAIGAFLEKIADFCVDKWKAVLVVALILALAGNYADSLVPIETNVQNYIPQDLTPLVDFNHMKAYFGGTDSLKFLVQADDITDPETLKWMDDFSNYLLKTRSDRVESVVSLATYIKQANGGAIPDDQTEIREIINALPEATRRTYLTGHSLAMVEVNLGDSERNLETLGMDRLVTELKKDMTWMTPPPGVSVSVTGDPVLKSSVIVALTSGRVEMSLLGLVLIFILLLLIYRDLIKALLPVLPMLVVIGWMGGVMYLGGLKYTPLTATLGALVLGVGSEYAILMMERFYEELHNVGDPYEALKITANHIGSALVASGMTVIFGFAALISSPFDIISNFGLVTVLSVIFALFTTFTVFVVLMIRMEIRREVFENAKQDLKKAIALINNQSWRRSNGN